MKRTLMSVLLLCLVVTPAFAHKIKIYGYAEGGKVYTESYFAGGSRCKGCTITAKNIETGAIIIQGTANEEGQFDFPYQSTEPLKLSADAGSGHMGTYILELEPLTQIHQQPSGREAVSEESSAIEALLERKLNPIHRELTSLREASERPGLTEVMGGIGYIIGLLGLWAYLKNRERRP